MMQTTVSIITVTYNSADTIKQAIESVLQQSYLPKEYILVDGMSTDDTLVIAKNYESQFAERGVYYRIISEKDNGIYDAMNKGISLASGDIIGMINSDDWYEPIALERMVNCYEKTGFDMFFADLRMHFPDGKTFIKHARNRKYATSRDWNHPTTFITKKMYEQYEYKCETIHDDYDLILRLKKNGARIEILNEVLANFRMNGTSHEKSIQKALERTKIKYRIYRNNGYSRFYLIECVGMELAKLLVK
ncbi:MAG TPA: glycosyltransferase family 2 protein [Lachnospiraceae bacterium]|nr:glycosyltransferase family 2 protein [Lachnospiraceae bacterium]